MYSRRRMYRPRPSRFVCRFSYGRTPDLIRSFRRPVGVRQGSTISSPPTTAARSSPPSFLVILFVPCDSYGNHAVESNTLVTYKMRRRVAPSPTFLFWNCLRGGGPLRLSAGHWLSPLSRLATTMCQHAKRVPTPKKTFCPLLGPVGPGGGGGGEKFNQ